MFSVVLLVWQEQSDHFRLVIFIKSLQLYCVAVLTLNEVKTLLLFLMFQWNHQSDFTPRWLLVVTILPCWFAASMTSTPNRSKWAGWEMDRKQPLTSLPLKSLQMVIGSTRSTPTWSTYPGESRSNLGPGLFVCLDSLTTYALSRIIPLSAPNSFNGDVWRVWSFSTGC